ncbi:MAG TPA: hypothetical protein PKL04_11770 [Methanofastidiosum sp.]|nr:hypothetical protein [Methanofastidiosum sp.]
MNTFTYLLGAGASYNVLPLVKNFPDRLEGFRKFIESIFPITIKENAELVKKIRSPREQFNRDMEDLIIETKNHASIDTYARKLYLTSIENELLKLKSLLDLFFSIEQFINGIDARYDAFFAALLTDENHLVKLPENINIISWNYDFQIELFLGSLLAVEDSRQLEERISIYPSSLRPTHDTFSIVKLNGTALGRYGNGIFNKEAFDPKIYKTKFIGDCRDRMIEKLIKDYFQNVYLSNPDQKYEPSILYSWEKGIISESARHYAKKIMSNTDYLIVIGYSFPTFNRTVDRDLLSSLKSLKTIYIQSPEETIDAVEQRLHALMGNTPQNNINSIPEVDEFFIPYEYK